jgi:predicted RNase H-like HicB family nuclease
MAETSSTKEIEIKAIIATYWDSRTRRYVAKCHALNLSASGRTADEAEKEMENVLALYVSKLARNKRLPKMLSKLPPQESSDTGA